MNSLYAESQYINRNDYVARISQNANCSVLFMGDLFYNLNDRFMFRLLRS